MAWYNEAVFYHIYPLGMTGAPKQNAYGSSVHRLNALLPWIFHVKESKNQVPASACIWFVIYSSSTDFAIHLRGHFPVSDTMNCIRNP